MNPLTHFRWYRRWRGGVWEHHSTWTRLTYMPADFSPSLGDEDWRGSGGSRLWSAAYDFSERFLPKSMCSVCWWYRGVLLGVVVGIVSTVVIVWGVS